MDSSDKKRLEETDIELYELLSDDKLEDVLLLVYAYKQDLAKVLNLTSIKSSTNTSLYCYWGDYSL